MVDRVPSSRFFGKEAFSNAYEDVTLDGALATVHDTVDQSAKDLMCTPKTSFPLQGDGFETRKGKFLNTMLTFFNGAGAVGSVLGVGVMLPVDFSVGLGSVGGCPLEDEGVLGLCVMGAGNAVSVVVDGVGTVTGGALAAASVAAKGENESYGEWIEEGMETGSNLAGTGAGHVLGTGTGLALNAARLPSIIVKTVLKGSFAVVGGIIGFFAASVRAIFNK